MFYSPAKFGELSDAQKAFERDDAIDLRKPVVIRVDGRAFHTFTRGLVKPYDERLGQCMIQTARYLVEKFLPTVGYVQSDEITLVFCNTKRLPFSGRIQKLVSLVASTATAVFNREVTKRMPEKQHMLPIFDGRIFNVPDVATAIDNVFWRCCDATRNSIFSAAYAVFSSKQLHRQGVNRNILMLAEKRQINWFTDYPAHFQVGTLLTRETKHVTMSDDELARIPEKYRPTGPVLRSVIDEHTPPCDFDARKDFIGKLFLREQDA